MNNITTAKRIKVQRPALGEEGPGVVLFGDELYIEDYVKGQKTESGQSVRSAAFFVLSN